MQFGLKSLSVEWCHDNFLPSCQLSFFLVKSATHLNIYFLPTQSSSFICWYLRQQSLGAITQYTIPIANNLLQEKFIFSQEHQIWQSYIYLNYIPPSQKNNNSWTSWPGLLGEGREDTAAIFNLKITETKVQITKARLCFIVLYFWGWVGVLPSEEVN